MKILIACEESQRVTIELRKLGHEAYSCDIIPCSGGHPEWHLQQDVIPLLQEKWDMIIAFPPCTYLSNAGACRLYPQKGQLDEERYKKGLQAKEFFMQFYNAGCPRIAIENPVSSKVFGMPLHTQEIEPYQFGDPYKKKLVYGLKVYHYCRLQILLYLSHHGYQQGQVERIEVSMVQLLVVEMLLIVQKPFME